MVFFSNDEWAPLREMQRVREELDRASRRGALATSREAFPPVDVWAADEGLVLSAELPGCTTDDVEVTVDAATLTLSGRRLEQEQAEGARYARRERAHGEFARTFELPFAPVADQVEARFLNGVLEIRVPRPEAERPRKIEIRSAS